MVYIFWGILFLMTLAAMLSVLLVCKMPRYTKILFVLLLPTLALALYWKVGASKDLLHYWLLKHEAKSVKQALSKIKSPQEVVDKLRAFLVKYPSNPKGWYLLGKLYYGQGDFQHALPALRKAQQQAPDHPIYTVAYAEADFFYHDRHLSRETEGLLHSVIRQHKAEVGALNLLAINDYLRGRYPQAIIRWERLLPLFSAGSKDEKFLLSMIAKAQSQRQPNTMKGEKNGRL